MSTCAPTPEAPPEVRSSTSYGRKIERQIQQDPALSVRRKGDLMLIASYADPDSGKIGEYAYYSFFASAWGCHRRTVIRRFRRFEDLGYVGIRRRATIEARAGEPNTRWKRNRANEITLLDGSGRVVVDDLPIDGPETAPPAAPASTSPAPSSAAPPDDPAPPDVPLSEDEREILIELAAHPSMLAFASAAVAQRYDAWRRSKSKTLAQALETIRDVAAKCFRLPVEVRESRLFSWLAKANPVTDRVALVGSLVHRGELRELDLEALATKLQQLRGDLPAPGISLAATLALIRLAAKAAADALTRVDKSKRFLATFREGLPQVAPPAPPPASPPTPAGARAWYSGRPP